MRLAAWVLAGTLMLAACTSDGSNPGAAVEGATLERTTTTTIPPAPHLESTSTIPVELVPPVEISRSGAGSSATGTAATPTKPEKLSWTGQKFEIGVIRHLVQGSGGWAMSFDPEEVHVSGGVRAGAQLTADPLVGITGPPTVTNPGTTLKLFGVSPDVTIVQTGPGTEHACGAVADGSTLTIAELAAQRPNSSEIDSLTFDADGQVTVINRWRSC